MATSEGTKTAAARSVREDRTAGGNDGALATSSINGEDRAR